MFFAGSIDDYGMEMLCSRLSLDNLSSITSTLSLNGTSKEQQRTFVEVCTDTIANFLFTLRELEHFPFTRFSLDHQPEVVVHYSPRMYDIYFILFFLECSFEIASYFRLALRRLEKAKF